MYTQIHITMTFAALSKIENEHLNEKGRRALRITVICFVDKY